MSTDESIAADAALEIAIESMEAEERAHARTCKGCDTCRPIHFTDML